MAKHNAWYSIGTQCNLVHRWWLLCYRIQSLLFVLILLDLSTALADYSTFFPWPSWHQILLVFSQLRLMTPNPPGFLPAQAPPLESHMLECPGLCLEAPFFSGFMLSLGDLFYLTNFNATNMLMTTSLCVSSSYLSQQLYAHISKCLLDSFEKFLLHIDLKVNVV